MHCQCVESSCNLHLICLCCRQLTLCEMVNSVFVQTCSLLRVAQLTLTDKMMVQVISKDVDHLYMSGDDEERKSIQQTSQMFAAQITQLLFKVPRVLLLLLKTNDCLRSVDLALGQVSVSFKKRETEKEEKRNLYTCPEAVHVSRGPGCVQCLVQLVCGARSTWLQENSSSTQQGSTPLRTLPQPL